MVFKSGELLGHFFSFQSFAGSSRRGIAERIVQRALSHVHFLPPRWLHSSTNFGSRNLKKKLLQLLFAKTLPLKLRHSTVAVLFSWYYFC